MPRLRRPKLDVAVRQPKCGKVLYHAVVKILCRSPFPAYAVYHLHPSYDYKGNGCSKRVETVGVYPFCPLPWVRQTLPPPQRRNPCPESANRLRGSGTPQKLCLRIPVREYDLNAKTAPQSGTVLERCLLFLVRRRCVMTAAAAMCAIAAAAAGLLDEDRTNRKEHDSHYDQSQNYITNTHGKSLLSDTEEISWRPRSCGADPRWSQPWPACGTAGR